MSSDSYQKVGRGGAGNYFLPSHNEPRQHDNRDANRSDTQTQPALSALTTPEGASSSCGSWARSGRGGAGNYYNAANTTALAAIPVTTPIPSSGVALGGRGGAGNWIGSAQADDEDKARQQDVDSRIARDVEASLPAPPPIYRAHSSGTKPHIPATP